MLEQAPGALRLADLRRRRVALAAIEPAVRPPVETVECLVAVADPPAGQAHLDVLDIGLVIAIVVRHEQQVRWCAEPQPTHPHRDPGREGDALEEHFARVGDTVVVAVLEDQDAAVTGVGESAAPGFVVAVLRDPHAAAIIPAECHRLRDHRLVGEGVDLEAVLQRHRGDGLLRGEEFRLAPLLLGDPPQRPGVLLAAPGSSTAR